MPRPSRAQHDALLPVLLSTSPAACFPVVLLSVSSPLSPRSPLSRPPRHSPPTLTILSQSELGASISLRTPIRTQEGAAAAEAMMRQPRPQRGGRRIDAAIDHLTQCGFAEPQIRQVISDLLQLYGRDGWLFLEEGSYRIVLEKLQELQEQAQQGQQQEAAAVEEASPPNGMEVPQVHPLQYELPVPPAKGPPCAWCTCHGWISEESETESEPEDGEMLSDVAGPVIFTGNVETLPSKRK